MTVESEYFQSFTVEEIAIVFESVKMSKALGHDGINNPNFLKHLGAPTHMGAVTVPYRYFEKTQNRPSF